MVCFVFYVTGFTSIVVYCFPPFLEHINTAPFWFTSRTSSMKHSTTSSLLLKRLQSTNEQKTDTVMGRGQTDLLAMWPIDMHTRPIVYFFIRLKCLTVKSLLCSCCRSTAVNNATPSTSVAFAWLQRLIRVMFVLYNTENTWLLRKSI